MLVFYVHTHTKAWTMHVCMCFTEKVCTMHVHVLYRERSDYACTCVVQRGLDCVRKCMCEVGVDFACPRARSGLRMCGRERGLYYACVCALVREVVWTVCTCERG